MCLFVYLQSYLIMCDAAYLSDVSLHHTNRIHQDVSGKPLYLLSESSAKQKGCEGNHINNYKKHSEASLFMIMNTVFILKETHSLCLSGRTWLATDLTWYSEREKRTKLQCTNQVYNIFVTTTIMPTHQSPYQTCDRPHQTPGMSLFAGTWPSF